MAIQNAEVRGRFELNCPADRHGPLGEVVQPVLQGRSSVREWRAEYDRHRRLRSPETFVVWPRKAMAASRLRRSCD
jgi:hypothetical protein